MSRAVAVALLTLRVLPAAAQDPRELHEAHQPHQAHETKTPPEQDSRDDDASWSVGARASTLGAGIQIVKRVHRRIDGRVGFNAFAYRDDFNYSGINYSGSLKLRSVEVGLAWFPFARRKFHLSPGIMLYDGNLAELQATVPGGQKFSLGQASYVSDRMDPVAGNLQVAFKGVRPMVLLGWSDLMPHANKRLSGFLEAGVVFQGAPAASLILGGSACDPQVATCRSIGVEAGTQDAVRSEQNKITAHESSHLYLRYYPVISIGVAYRF